MTNGPDPPEVLFSDDSVLVVAKPAGLSVLTEGWDRGAPYLVNMLEQRYSKVWVVHRLDKNTSGVMVFALTAEAHRNLNLQFERHQVEKKYHAILTGSPPWERKTTRFPLRVNVGHQHRTVVDNRSGVRAETRFELLRRFGDCALVEAQPLTGRTHQIRVHAYALGHPLLGDTLYSAPPTQRIARPALHALSIRFAHPESGKTLTYSAPYPADLDQALKFIEAG
jgi:RluA family pseudouridine synthase